MAGEVLIPLKKKYRVKKDGGHKSAGHGAGVKKRPNHKSLSEALKKLQRESDVRMARVLLPSMKTVMMRYEDVPWSE